MAETIADVAALAALWDHDRNAKSPSEELAKSYKTAWWKCKKGHSFQRKPRMLHKDVMDSGVACPTCSLGGTSLADSHPGLAARWHADKNSFAASGVDASHTAAA